jgi:hypothetical protein
MFKFDFRVTVKRQSEFKVKFGFRLQHAPNRISGEKTLFFGPLHIACSCRVLSC